MTSLIAPVAGAAAAPKNPAPAAGQPATTRVTILTGRRLTDLVLPATATMDSYLDDTVAALAELSDDAPADVLAGFDFAEQGVWAFARPGGPPLKADQSLDDAGVVDGSLLTLVTVSHTERYRPLVEDVIDAIAVLDESPQFDRSALNRAVALGIPALLVVLSAVAVQAWWNTGRNPLWSAALGGLGVVLLAGSMAATRIYKNVGLSESLLVAAFPVTAVAAALAVPLPVGSDGLGAPQLAAGAAAVLDRSVPLAVQLLAATGRSTVDVVADVVGGPAWPELIALLRRGGRAVVSGALAGPVVPLDLRALYLADLTLAGATVQPRGLFADLVGYLERGEVTPSVAAVYRFDQVREAQAAFLSVGYKVYLEVRSLGLDRTPRAAYAAIAGPALIIHGETSPPAARRVATLVAESIPRGAVRALPGAGHMGPITHGPAFGELIRGHLASS
jgi:hypothetical protein